MASTSTQSGECKSNRISHLLLMQIKYGTPVLKGSLAISDKIGHAITLRASNYVFGFLPMELKMYDYFLKKSIYLWL